MKTNSHIKFANMLDLIQVYFDSLAHSLSIGRIDLLKVIADSAKPTLRERKNTYNPKLQKSRLNRRHHSINWRWQSRLLK